MVTAENLISGTIPVVHPSDTGQKVLNCMDLYRVSHLAVTNGTEYLGLVSDQFIGDLALENTALEGHLAHLLTPHAHPGHHLFEVAALMARLRVSLMPVVDEEHRYMGSVTWQSVSERFAQLISLQEPGGVLVLRTTWHNYSPAQIGQIAESSDTRILSLFVSRIPDSDFLEITLKLDKVDLSPLIQTFERYGYQIAASIMDESLLHDLYEDRLGQFFRYINV